ncbi:MAG: hypothetical protein ABL934_12235 [Lysobacteraceae bacterium]
MKTDRKSRSNRSKAPLLTTLALACAFMAGNAGATGIPVIDGAKIFQDVAKYIKEAMEWVKTGQHYVQQVNDMKDRITNPSQMFLAYQLQFAEDFKKKGITDGVSDRCGGGSGFPSLSELLGAVGLSPNNDIVAQQKMICTRIVMLENQKYNDQIDIMKGMLQNAQKDIDKLTAQGQASTTQGQMQTTGVGANPITQQIMLDAQKAKVRADLFDGMIDILKEQQKALAVVALNGKSSPIDVIADTLILKTALKVNN